MLSLVLAVSAAISGAPPLPPCPIVRIAPTAASPLRGGLHKLGDLPDANQVLLVMRSVNGCPYQQVVRFNVSTGGSARLAPPGGVLVPDGARVMPAAPAKF